MRLKWGHLDLVPFPMDQLDFRWILGHFRFKLFPFPVLVSTHANGVTAFSRENGPWIVTCLYTKGKNLTIAMLVEKLFGKSMTLTFTHVKSTILEREKKIVTDLDFSIALCDLTRKIPRSTTHCHCCRCWNRKRMCVIGIFCQLARRFILVRSAPEFSKNGTIWLNIGTSIPARNLLPAIYVTIDPHSHRT